MRFFWCFPDFPCQSKNQTLRRICFLVLHVKYYDFAVPFPRSDARCFPQLQRVALFDDALSSVVSPSIFILFIMHRISADSLCSLLVCFDIKWYHQTFRVLTDTSCVILTQSVFSGRLWMKRVTNIHLAFIVLQTVLGLVQVVSDASWYLSRWSSAAFWCHFFSFHRRVTVRLLTRTP